MDWIWYHALPLIVFGVPLIGFLWELLVGLLCRKNCWLLSLPVLAGALGLALCLLAQSSLSLSFLLGFWAAYGCALLFGWSLSQLRTQGISAGKSGYAGEWRCAPARRWLSASAY